MITSPGICPYSRFSPELREKWHKERGIEDPLKKVVEKERILMSERSERMEDPAPYKPEEVIKPVIKESGSVPLVSKDGMTKQERYRARNKEKLAEKARARRAKK